MDLQSLQSYADSQAAVYGVPTDLFRWQIGQESSWNPNAQNGNATGIGQFMPDTARRFGIDPSNPYQSLTAAAQLDSQLYAQTGSWQGAMTKYGTLANVPQSVMDKFHSVMQSITENIGDTTPGGTASLMGLSGSLTSPVTQNAGTNASGSNAALTNITPDSFIAKIAYIVLGIVIIAGAIYTYMK